MVLLVPMKWGRGTEIDHSILSRHDRAFVSESHATVGTWSRQARIQILPEAIVPGRKACWLEWLAIASGFVNKNANFVASVRALCRSATRAAPAWPIRSSSARSAVSGLGHGVDQRLDRPGRD